MAADATRQGRQRESRQGVHRCQPRVRRSSAKCTWRVILAFANLFWPKGYGSRMLTHKQVLGTKHVNLQEGLHGVLHPEAHNSEYLKQVVLTPRLMVQPAHLT